MPLKETISASDYVEVSRVKGVRKWRVTVSDLEYTDWKETTTKVTEEVLACSQGAAYDTVVANAQPAGSGQYNYSMGEDVRQAGSFILTRDFEDSVQESIVTAPVVPVPTVVCKYTLQGYFYNMRDHGAYADGLENFSSGNFKIDLPLYGYLAIQVYSNWTNGPNRSYGVIIQRSGGQPLTSLNVMSVSRWDTLWDAYTTTVTAINSYAINGSGGVQTKRSHAVQSLRGAIATAWRVQAYNQLIANDGTVYRTYSNLSADRWQFIYGKNNWTEAA